MSESENRPVPGEARTPDRYSLREEVTHAVTHGIGAVASIAGLAILVGFSMLYGDGWHVLSSSIFGATLILLYMISTLYHAVTHPQVKRVLHILDHCAIYLLIAGTYSPFLLVTFRDSFGLAMFAAIWVMAFAGVGFKIFFTGRFLGLSTAIYLGMGWMVLLIIGPFVEMVPTGGLWLMVLGGLAYTGGVVFFLWESLPYSHAVWHGFVLAGSVLHFFAVLFYVIPFPA